MNQLESAAAELDCLDIVINLGTSKKIVSSNLGTYRKTVRQSPKLFLLHLQSACSTVKGNPHSYPDTSLLSWAWKIWS